MRTYLARTLTWRTYLIKKENKPKLIIALWLLGSKSKLLLTNKLFIYKCILKPSYGIQVWGAASHSNIEILQRFQNKTLRQIFEVPKFTPYWSLHKYLNKSYIKDETKKLSNKYKARLTCITVKESHSNVLKQENKNVINRNFYLKNYWDTI